MQPEVLPLLAKGDPSEYATHEVVRLMGVMPVESPDATVIAKAQEIDAILLTLNGDFADIVTYPPKDHKGIAALQVRNHPEIVDR